MNALEHYIHHFVFGVYPYICLSVFFLGSLIRFDRDQYSWRSGSSEVLRKRQLVLGSNLWHVGVLVVLGGHLVGLLTPPAVYHAFGLTDSGHALMAMIAGGVFGVIAWIGLTILVHRRLFDIRIRRSSSIMDIVILLLLWTQLTIGLSTVPISWGTWRDPQEMMALSAWVQHILTFRSGAADLIVDVPWDYKLHLFLGMTVLFLLAPFSRLIHIWSAPVWYLGRRYQVVRTRKRVSD
jgi:nitrate reductase gamma subunit